MATELIIINEYCSKSHTDPSFITLLEQEGLIDIQVIEGIRYLFASQLRDLEKYTRLHYDLSINIEGIGAVSHLLDKMDLMQKEIKQLKKQLDIYRTQIGEIE